MAAVLAMMLASSAVPPEPGISESLARERAAAVRDLRYELELQVPVARTTPVAGRVVVRFSLAALGRVVLDFSRPKDAVRGVRLDGHEVAYELVNGHLVIASATAGSHYVSIDFVAGDDALNRNDEFLYTLFVPARARLTFPCFDQPDLKARYSLTLTVPTGWQAVSNGATLTTADAARVPGTTSLVFAETQPLPTYLFAFAAGRFSVETAERGGRQFRLFHRETDAAKVARNRDAIFDQHAAALAWLEDYTAIPYAFGKFDIVAIPAFTFGGMEHAGAIFYNASSLLLDESATQNQMLDRANVIAHETSHMWFGDLVTMRWFNDVWMKEVFANFMADKIVNPSFPTVNHQLRFLLAHYPSAYSVDRTDGTNAIRQVLGNLDEAGQMYGPIIYDKAPVVMRQLEMIMGAGPFRDGLREYLKTYQFGNATWLDLVRTLDAKTPRDLAAWSRAWVEERGRPTITTRVRGPGSLDPGNRIASITLTSRDGMGRGLVWPQQLSVSVGYDGDVKSVTVDMRTATAAVPGVEGRERPRFVLPNGGGLGYGLFVLDDASRAYLVDHVEQLPDPLLRGSAWVTLWDNLLEGAIPPPALFETALRALPVERDEQNVQRILGYAARIYWRFLSPAQRQPHAGRLESVLREGLARAATQSEKSAWFNAYRDTVMSPEGLAWLERVWRRQERVPGLTLAEPDEITLAMELAVREVPRWKTILDEQLARTQNPDRKDRLAFVMPALSADPAERERSFERFTLLENRRREVWVQDSLQYLNHPLRAAHGQRFVQPALEMLREIQRTGDIFFPTRWMERTLWGYRSPEVATTVRAFLARQKDYPQRLRWTILSTADELFRASRVPS
ncbi:MAG TPA: M1 family aminopeptidase [Vicinamibacterales bacterium]|nr:M1 family aminopeptidase [Vicinamibacterales bacterium]